MFKKLSLVAIVTVAVGVLAGLAVNKMFSIESKVPTVL